jgi:hypothetical protein
LKNPDISVVAPREAMPAILSSRFKGQRELASGQPGFDPKKFGRREQVEADLLGYPLSTPDSMRPIYGAVANRAQLPQWLLERTPGRLGAALRLFDPRTNDSGFFGLNNAVINRLPASKVAGTYTVGDSWAPFLNSALELGGLSRPSSVRKITDAIATARANKTRVPYIEAQMNPSRNPVDAIREIAIPPSYSDVWAAAVGSAKRRFTSAGAELYDPIIKEVPKVVKKISGSEIAQSTARLQEELYNNLVRPKIPQRLLPQLLKVEKDSVRSAKGRAFFASGGPVTGRDKMPRMTAGGLVSPKYFNAGGLARGTDTIPAMLSPGEFVMRKAAVDRIGISNLQSMNNGSFSSMQPSYSVSSITMPSMSEQRFVMNSSSSSVSVPVNNASASQESTTKNLSSVYNYNLSVNVKSDANPDQIAKTVMSQIRQVDSQRIRSNRF